MTRCLFRISVSAMTLWNEDSRVASSPSRSHLYAEVSLQEARELYGDRLAIASLGAIRKSDNSVRVVRDATHGQNINNVIKVRAQRIPAGTDLTCALAMLPAFFSMSGDIARAHRLIRVRSSNWGFQACRARDPSRVFLNCVGTFGMASAAYWWHRLMAMIGRLVYFMHGRDETILMTYVDDLVWLTQSHQGLHRILGSLFFMVLLGVPFAWKKFSGGQEHGWIGLSLDVSARMVGISKARAEWVICWLRKTRSDGIVRIADLRAVLGRLSFAFGVIPLLRPFLGPIYAWVAAAASCHTLRLPKTLHLVFLFLETALQRGWRRSPVRKGKALRLEHFRTDAKADGSDMRIGGWCTSDSPEPKECRWFSEKVDHMAFPAFYMAGESYRAISSLEMLASFVALRLFKPHGVYIHNHCSAGTDIKGNSHVLSRWMTTSFSLLAVLMEMSAFMLEANIGLELFWLPRLQNHLADSLADGDWKDFDPSKRLRFSLNDHEWLVMDRLLETGLPFRRNCSQEA